MTDPAWRRLYPFSCGQLAIDDHRYNYVDVPPCGPVGVPPCGPVGQGRGSVLLMVHGNPTWSFYWRRLIAAFCDRHRVIAPDHIGCGLSDKPRRYNYTLTQHIANLTRLIEHLDLRDITLMVHDWGGAIGLGAALQAPDRFSRLILFNTGAFPPPYVPRRIAICRTPLLGPLAVRGLNLFARAALVMAVAGKKHGGRSLTKEVKQGLLAPYASWGRRRAIMEFIRDIPFSPRHPTWKVLETIEQQLPSLACKSIQINWGMQDWCFTTVCLERFKSLFPRAEVNELQQAGHYLIEEAHDEIISLVSRFLNDTNNKPGPGKCG